MTEETNLTIENDGFMDGFEDDGAVATTDDDFETIEETEAVEEVTEETTEVTEQPAETKAVTLKYMGKETAIPADVAESMAQALGVDVDSFLATYQKGMNYDRNLSKKMEETAEIQILNRYAELNGMTREEYINALETAAEQKKVQEEQSKLIEKYPYSDENLIKELAEKNIKAQKDEALKAEQKAAQEKREQAVKGWQELLTAHPDLDVKNLPPEIIQAVAGGQAPSIAYQAYENAQLKSQLADMQNRLSVFENNKKNKEKSIGSVRSEASALSGEDALFMEGFNSY